MKGENSMIRIKKFLFIALAAFVAAGVFGFCFAGANLRTASAQEFNGNYYFADYDTAADAYNAGDKLNKEILSEGITLLKNENSLPLKQNAKVSLFGKRSADLRYGGAGSGAGSGGAKITVRQSLERAGIEVNDALADFYANNSQSGTAGGGLGSYNVFAGPSSGMGETSVDTIKQYVDESTFDEYGDAAIVVISRAGSEAGDLPKGMSTGYGSDGKLNGKGVAGARNYDDHYLQLDANETALLQYVGDNFDNVIVVLNTGSQFETGFLDDPGHYAYHENIKGALWMGFPGNGNGLEALGEILVGKTNPSGHTVDTWSRDFKLDPTWSNMATYTNYLFNYSNFNKSLVNYSEGIYVGYRYYETRGYTEGKPESGEKYTASGLHGTTTTQWDSWYDANVIYPFGHGLSYTTFDWEFVGSNVQDGGMLDKDGSVNISVKVTNTGEVAGKDVLQLYFTAPYTEGGIEKSHVELGDFAKTDLLAPGESQTMTLSVKVRDMASYDYADVNKNGFKGFETEEGVYGIKISRNAHDAVIEKEYSVPKDGYMYDESESGNAVENRFEDAEMKGTTYLSRSDFAGTFPKKPTSEERVASQEVKDAVTETSDNNAIIAADDPSDPWYTDEMPTTGANNGIMLEDLYGLDYDDPMWDSFLDQLVVGNKNTQGTMAYTIWTSGWTTNGIDKFGIPKFSHEDGPSGIAGRYVGGSYTNFASETVTASTWNKELAYKKGLMIGNQGLFGNGGSNRVHALYAPACNIHRSAFGGRNFEYFSEDALLSGEMAGNIVKGCNEKGMITFVKHFAVNDQESKRDTLLTWANEQTIREIYLEPFRICVEKYESHGMMSALNSLGAVWTGGNYALLTEVLRGEWGFNGIVITDYVQSRGQLNGNMAIRAGGDILLATSGSVQNPVGLDQPTTVACMRQAMHNLYYNIVNYTAAFNVSTINVLGSYSGGTLSPAIDSVPYEQSVATVALNNGALPSTVRYSLKEGSSLPEGLTLSADGIISGTAELQAEASVFTVVAKCGLAEREATFTLPVADKTKSIIYIKQTESINCTAGGSVSADIDWAYTLDGKHHDITYRLAEGSVLPEGMTLSADGKISGSSVIPFTGYKITVIAESEDMLPMSVTLTLNSYKDYAFASSQLPTARFGTSYSARLGSGGDGTLKYTLRTGDSLPQGMTLTENGMLIGTPAETGKVTFTVIASGPNYQTREQTFTVDIGVRYDSFELDDAQAGTGYEAFVNFAQGANDVQYTLESGELPRGMTLSRDGKLSGTPLESGNYTFTVLASSGGLSDSVKLSLHVSDATSYEAYAAGLAIGITCTALVVSGLAVYALVIGKRNFADGKFRPKRGFLSVAAASMGCVLAVVLGCGIAFAPMSAGGSQQTFTFEAEYVYLDDFMGAGISNSGEGVNNIYGSGAEGDIEKGWSNGYFLGNTYAENSIEFKITSDRNASGRLVLRLASELGNMKLDNSVFGVEVNGKEVDYSITVANSATGSYDFADYPITGTIQLAAGENVIKLTIKENTLKDGNSIGAPLIDCIRITTDAELTWEPLTDNPDRRGEV